MNTSISFTVTLTFSDKITDDDTISDIAKNINRAIATEVETGMGIIPDYMDGYTESLSVNKDGEVLAESSF